MATKPTPLPIMTKTSDNLEINVLRWRPWQRPHFINFYISIQVNVLIMLRRQGPINCDWFKSKYCKWTMTLKPNKLIRKKNTWTCIWHFIYFLEWKKSQDKIEIEKVSRHWSWFIYPNGQKRLLISAKVQYCHWFSFHLSSQQLIITKNKKGKLCFPF